ncbi:MAG TPA: HDIG domain-containing metalloprotein [Oculatellaceae cyanobacterium]
MGSDGDSKLQPTDATDTSPEARTASGQEATAKQASTKASLPSTVPAHDLGHSDSHHAIFHTVGALVTWVTICIIGFASLCFFLTAHHLFNPGFKVGEQVRHDLVAKRATMVVDQEATQEARNKARNAVVPIFSRNKDADEQSLKLIHQRLGTLSELQKAGVQTPTELAMFTPSELTALACCSETDFASLLGSNASTSSTGLSQDLLSKWSKATSKENLRQVVTSDLQQDRAAVKKILPELSELDRKLTWLAFATKPADLQSTSASIESAHTRLCRTCSRLPQDCQGEVQQHAFEYLPESLPLATRKIAADVMASSAIPNMEIDKKATEEKMANTESSVKPIIKHINVGQLIVPKNTILTQEHVDTLQNIGASYDVNQWPLVLSLWLSLASATALVGLFLYAYEPKHLFSSSSVALIFTLSTVACATSTTFGHSYPAYVPLPAIALLLTIFLGQRVAVAVTIPTVIFLAVDRLVDTSNLIALGTAAGAAIAVYSRRRHSLIASGLVMSIAQGVAYFLSALVSYAGISTQPLAQVFSQLFPSVMTQFGGGMVSAILAIGSLPFLENIFGMVTPFRLAEMTDADQPLLRRLEENAPGTYQHSLAVANLAEAGARAIGGDVNLVRAGAFYHDVGKMVRPRYFIENQLGDKNPHDSMSPEDSRERVLAHVTDGIALAKEYNLPKAVQDFIPMHQGTSLMAYFYHKACLRDGAENVDPNFYRYPGPKPQSKETSIVMLADVSEAVTHSMHDPSQEEVEAAMTKVFQNRWDDGQFNEAGLTYGELEKVKKAFVHVWRTLHHERLKYPSTTTGRMAVPPAAVPPSAAASGSTAAQVLPATTDKS